MTIELVERLEKLAEDVGHEYDRSGSQLDGAAAAMLYAVAGAIHAGQAHLLRRHGEALTRDGKAGLQSRRN